MQDEVGHGSHSEFVPSARTIVWHLDEPFAISSAYATYYLARHAARKTKVVLTGDGGDELFAGYDGYADNGYLKRGVFFAPTNIAFHTLFAIARLLRPANSKFNRLLTGLARRTGSEGLRYSERLAQNSLLANSMAFKPEVFYGALTDWRANLVAHYYDGDSSGDRLHKKLLAEFKTRLVDEMLMKVDRMTMAHSLEARVPLLDHELAEFAFGLPSDMKMRRENGRYESKYIMKRAMEGILPNEIIYRKKQGFDIPVKGWLKGEFLRKVGDKVLGGHLREWGLIEPAGVIELMKRQSDSRHSYNNMLMLLLAFESWADVYHQRIGRITWG
jgi:asparagine synthase (glutamine-hydrolysing)